MFSIASQKPLKGIFITSAITCGQKHTLSQVLTLSKLTHLSKTNTSFRQTLPFIVIIERRYRSDGSVLRRH